MAYKSIFSTPKSTTSPTGGYVSIFDDEKEKVEAKAIVKPSSDTQFKYNEFIDVGLKDVGREALNIIKSPFKKYVKWLNKGKDKTPEEKEKEDAIRRLTGYEGKKEQIKEEEKVKIGESSATFDDVYKLLKEEEKKIEKLAKVFTAPVRWTAGALATALTSYALEKAKSEAKYIPKSDVEKLIISDIDIQRLTKQEDMYGMIARGVGIPATLIVMALVENPFLKSTGIGTGIKTLIKKKIKKEAGELTVKIGAKELSKIADEAIQTELKTGKITKEEATKATQEVVKMQKTKPPILKVAKVIPEKPLKQQPIRVEPLLTTPKVSKRISDETIAKGLADGLGDLPEREIIHFKDQSKLVGQIIEENPGKAIRIALGKELPTNGALPESVFTAVKNQAIRNADVDLLRQLATEPGGVATESSILGARIKMLDEGAKDDAFSRMNQLVKDRKKRIEGTKKKPTGKKVSTEKKAEVKKIKEKIKKPDKYDWNNFIKSIECKV